MSISELARPVATGHGLGALPRWRLTRAGVHGLAGLDQVFECAGGRLVLRGSGVPTEAPRLLCLPLDADVRRALGRTVVDATGFVWLEFTRSGRTFVIGVALGPGRTRYFVTPVPIGDSLPLDEPSRRPSLTDLPGLVGAGGVFDDPAAYLERVAEVFGVGTDRLRDVTHALRQLRQPGLIARLTGADGVLAVLPTLDPILVTEAAAAFADLDVARAELVRLEGIRTAVTSIGDAHHAYLRAVAVERAGHVRAAMAAVERTGRERDTLRSETARAETAMKEITDRLRSATPHGGEELRTRWRDLGYVRELDEQLTTWHDTVTALARRELADLHREWTRTRALAGSVDLPAPPENPDAKALTAWSRELREAGTTVAGYAATAEAVRDGTAAWTRARADTHETARRVADLETRLAGARQRLRAREAHRDTMASAYRTELSAWITEAVDTGLARDDLDVLPGDRLDPDAPRRVAAAVRTTAAPLFARATADLATARSRLDRFTAELRDAEQDVPEPDRHARWYLRVEFAHGVSDAGQAGLEAALEATGLLDARLVSDAPPSNPFAEDRAVSVYTPIVGTSLADVLVPIDPGDRALADMLHGIGLGESAAAHWVGLDGRWRLGPVRGTGTKPHAEHLGADNRAKTHRRLLAGTERRVNVLTNELAAATTAYEAATADRHALEDLLDRIPDGQRLREAWAACAIAADVVTAYATELAAAKTAAVQARTRAAATREQADPARSSVEDLIRAASDSTRLADRVTAAADEAAQIAARLDAYAALAEARDSLRERHASTQTRYASAGGGSWPPPGELLDTYATRRDALARLRARVEQADNAHAARGRDMANAVAALRTITDLLGFDGETPADLLTAVAPLHAPPGDAEDTLRAQIEHQRPHLDGLPVTVTRTDGLLAVHLDDGFAARVDAYADELADREHGTERWYDRLAADLTDRVRVIDETHRRLNALLARVGPAHHIEGSVTWEVTSHRLLLDLLRAERTPAQEAQVRVLLADLVADQRRTRPDAHYPTALWTLDPRTWGHWHTDVRDPLALALVALAAAYPDTGGAARVVALDGLDEDHSSTVVPLLTTLDLDLVATGRDLWGRHGTTRELDAYEILRDPAGPAVAAVHVRWNGTT